MTHSTDLQIELATLLDLEKDIVENAIRLPRDVNGNSRWFINSTPFPPMSDKTRLACGLKKYTGILMGTGFVIQSTNLMIDIREALNIICEARETGLANG